MICTDASVAIKVIFAEGFTVWLQTPHLSASAAYSGTAASPSSIDSMAV